MSHVQPGIAFPSPGVIAATVQIKNNGRTPANITAVVLDVWPGEELPEQPPYLDLGKSKTAGFYLSAGDEFFKRITKTVAPEVVSQVRSGAPRAWLLGYVDYTDTFERRHRAGYARRYEPDVPGEQNNLALETKAGYNYDSTIPPNEGNAYQGTAMTRSIWREGFMVFFTFVIAAATIGQAVTTYLQWGVSRKALDATERAWLFSSVERFYISDEPGHD